MSKINYQELKDEELLVMSSQGNKHAEEELLCRYKNYVRKKVRPYFLVGADTDDIVQEGMIGLYKAIRDYKVSKNDNFRAFADLCITRQVITAVKTSLRNKHAPLNSYISLNRPVYDDDNSVTFYDLITKATASDPEEVFIDNETTKEINSKIHKTLSKFEYLVFERFLQGNSYAEIAEETGKTLKSIDNALQRIKKKISQLLTE